MNLAEVGKSSLHAGGQLDKANVAGLIFGLQENARSTARVDKHEAEKPDFWLFDTQRLSGTQKRNDRRDAKKYLVRCATDWNYLKQ